MRNRFGKILFSLTALVIIFTLLAACATTTEEPVAEEPAAEEPAAEEPAEEEPMEESKVGGTLVWAVGQEPDTLDMHRTALGVSWSVMWWAGGALLSIRDGEVGPYLAESWTVSEDGTTIEFALKQGVIFHDGSPLTAQDWVYTLLRAVDPETASPGAGPSLGALVSAEAIDDYTLKVTWETPNAGLFASISDRGYLQPLSQEAIESLGEDYGRNPVGVGPFNFEEWVTGDHITLVRNPDFNWGPPSDDGPGPLNFEKIEFRVIPEYSTRLAGFEANEVDVVGVEPQDIDRISELETAQIFTYPTSGFGPYIAFNLSKAPWDDLAVRKAIYMALDRQSMLDLVVQGKGEVQYGPLSRAVMGFADVEDQGFPYDVAAANAMLDEAGYTAGEDGIREMDGQRLSYTLYFFAGDATSEKTATVIESSLKEIGIELELQQSEIGTLFGQIIAGDYDIMLSGIGWNEADILYMTLHSSQIGALNYHFTQDPELDALLEAERATMDPTARQEALVKLQEYILEQVIYVPLFAANNYYAINTRVHDASFNANYQMFDFSTSYIEE